VASVLKVAAKRHRLSCTTLELKKRQQRYNDSLAEIFLLSDQCVPTANAVEAGTDDELLSQDHPAAGRRRAPRRQRALQGVRGGQYSRQGA
jgi:hypothetical protein